MKFDNYFVKNQKKGSSLFGIIQLLLFHLDDGSAVLEPVFMHAAMMRSALCSCVPHSKLQDGARPRLRMYNQNARCYLQAVKSYPSKHGQAQSEWF